jgi:hypothetical protein
LDGVACLVEMEVGAATLDLFIDLGDHCDRKGGMTPDSRDSLRVIPSSPRGAGGGGGGARRYLLYVVASRRATGGGLLICLIEEVVLRFFSRG